MQDPDVESLSSFVGVDAANNTMLHTGSMLINLKKSHGKQADVMQRLRERVRRWPASRCTCSPRKT
jgi:multidrug efflux pump